jgi:sigma-B regulation protein RsbU (phosphoserine phosphatase)
MEVVRLITSSLDLEEVLERIMTTSREVMGADASSLMLLDESTGELVFQVAQGSVGEKLREGFRLPLGQGIAGTVCLTGEPILVEDAYSDPRFHRDFDKRTGYRTKSLLCVPLKIQERIIGVAQVINRLDGRPFTKEDLETFSALCQHAAIAIENARIHRELLRRERLQRDLELASAVQQSFLPREVPAMEGYTLAAHYQAALEVGGDFYDFIPLRGNKWGIVIGDVSGKGVSSALYMAKLTSDFRIRAVRGRSPARTIEEINRELYEKGTRGTFVTLLYLVVKPPEGTIRFVNAGHIPPFIWEPETSSLWPASTEGDPPAGVLPGRSFTAHSFELKQGQWLVLTTDGLLEAKGPAGTPFGWEGLKRALEKGPQEASAMVANVVEALEEFTRGSPPSDDVTLVVMGVGRP